MTKYTVGVPIDFMDGTHAEPGDVVDLDPAKVTDITDLEHTFVNGVAALAKIDEPAPVLTGKTSKFAAPVVPEAGPPPTEVTAND